PGGPGGGHGGIDLEPLVSIDNPRMPLRSKVLAVPALKQRYLQNVRTIAEASLDWKSLGPVVAQARSLIITEVKSDTRKLESFEAFLSVTSGERVGEGQQPRPSLRSFVEQRRQFLLKHADLAKLPRN
ncbi:MAG: CotH kinase family protein, partial [Planctomycetaceae bacterium]